uniref:VPS37 C-terminal domain-containing protein n=1 Tax=Acrobeloides nanus TaxID=290746 RepID=A0A914CLE0_9BILA
MCVNSLMSSVRNYTDDQLQVLLNDDARLNIMVDNLPQVTALPADKDMKLAQSKSMAECNLSMEPKLNEAKSRLQSTYTEAVKAKQDVETLKSKLDSLSENRSLDTVAALLQAAAREAEDQSDDIADKFMNGDVEIEDFVKKFQEKRVLSHMRKVKSDKLMTILRDQQYAAPPPAPSHATPYPSAMGSGYPNLAGYRNPYPAQNRF